MSADRVDAGAVKAHELVGMYRCFGKRAYCGCSEQIISLPIGARSAEPYAGEPPMTRDELFELADRIADTYGEIVTSFSYGPQSGRYSLTVMMPNGDTAEVHRHEDWEDLEPGIAAWHEWSEKRETALYDVDDPGL